ncbi:rod shape-determining protein MreC [Aquibacillus kalidii]|uniref:rod shape-determining protein MreC n=1 Tax=Aquibacillus kalidii TaxID=2762597 RepID=UPI0016481E48|nr:rod shape-determining protein MreC [Aquibacillus kalidii]
MLFFRKKRLFIILIGFILLVGLIGFSLRDRDELTTAEQFLKDTVGWIQGIAHVPVEFTTTIFSNIDEIKNVYKENQVLKERLGKYKLLVHENQELKIDNEELQSILDKTESIKDFVPIQASVVSRSHEQWFKLITINKGKQDGVEANMAVITGEGMIGKVQTASQFTSTVLLLNGFDRSNRISVSIDVADQDKDPSGFIVGYDEESDSLLLELTEYDSKVNKDDLVVSSGLGGLFISGLEIGKIKEVNPDQYGLTQVAYVEPSADLYAMNHVIVVDRVMPTPDEEKLEEEE